MGEVRVLYKCLVCGKAYGNVQSLRAHLRVHRDVEFENFTVRLPKVLCERFREVCRRRNTTTCHVIFSVLTSIVEGERLGVVNIATHNPLIINLNTIVAARPRGRGKYNFAKISEYGSEALEPRCVLCGEPAVGEGVQPDGWRFGFCSRHVWLRNWAPVSWNVC